MFCSDFRPKKDIPVPISAGRIASRVVARLFRPFEFQGGVGDSRVFEQVFDPVLERWNLFRVADGDMGCQGVLGRADGPDVQVVNVCDFGIRIEDFFPDPLAVDPGRTPSS